MERGRESLHYHSSLQTEEEGEEDGGVYQIAMNQSYCTQRDWLLDSSKSLNGFNLLQYERSGGEHTKSERLGEKREEDWVSIKRERRAISPFHSNQLYLPCHRSLPGSSSCSQYQLPWQQAPPQTQGMSCLGCVERASKTAEGPVEV